MEWSKVGSLPFPTDTGLQGIYYLHYLVVIFEMALAATSGPTRRISPHGRMVLLPQQVRQLQLDHGIPVAATNVYLIQVLMANPVVVVAAMVEDLLEDPEMDNGGMESISLDQQIQELSVSSLESQMILRNYRLESISPTTMTFPSKHRVTTSQNLCCNLLILLWMTIFFRTSSSQATRHLHLCRNTRFPLSWVAET